jgi:hypothetical protein
MKGVPLARLVIPSLLSFTIGCGGDDDHGVTYADDIRPLFEDRCAVCHRPGAPYGPGTGAGPDIHDPFAMPDGLVNAPNLWYSDKPGHSVLPQRLVVSGQPDDSFVINKIADPALGLLPEDAGEHMPLQIERITADELARIEQWVSDGAQDNAFYDQQVRPIFVSTSPGVPGKCDTCHYANTPDPPDLTDPFGANGLVNIPSRFRADLLRVVPNDPDASLLVQRVRASAGDNLPSSEYGSPMPKPIAALTTEQVDQVRQWIAEGARP